MKSGVAAGLVYWTNSEGLWGSSDDVQDLYHRMLATVAPSALAGHDCDDVTIDSRDIDTLTLGRLAFFAIPRASRSISDPLRVLCYSQNPSNIDARGKTLSSLLICVSV